MRLLICGGRDYCDAAALDRAVAELQPILVPTLIIQGGARGADALAKAYALHNGIHCAEVLAMWDYYGKKAGYLRNDAMMRLAPEYCIALPGGRGTDSMCRLIERANIPLWRPYG